MGIVGRKLLCDVGRGCSLLAEMGMWEWLMGMLVVVGLLGLIVPLMARTKTPKNGGKAASSSVERAVKKRKPNPSQPVKKRKGKRHESESEEEDSEDEEIEAMFEEELQDEEYSWVQSLTKRGFQCERSVELRTFAQTHAIHDVIRTQNLGFLCKPLEGYHPAIVREFYSNLREHGEIEYHLKTTVNGKPILVGTSNIAAVLGYPRPSHEDGVPYPFRPLTVFNGASFAQAMCQNPVPMVSFTRREFTPGKLKPEYALMHKISHCSLVPKGKEKAPRIEKIRFLYEVMNGGKIDFAAVIWAVMKDFVSFTNKTSYMPFPCLVTQIVRAEGIKMPPKSKMSPPNLGPISSITEARSIAASAAQSKGMPAQSQPVATGPTGPSSSSAPKPTSSSPLKRMERRIKGWFKCILGKQKQMDHRLTRLEREVHTLRGDPTDIEASLPNLEGDSDELDEFVDEDDFSDEEDGSEEE